MAWGNKWNEGVPPVWPTPKQGDTHTITYSATPGFLITVDLDKTSKITETGKRIIRELMNKVPTHDPYTNPNAFIYYECACGAILDPGTKSFASLNNHAMNSGWKIRWGNHEHYQAYCVKCGKDID